MDPIVRFYVKTKRVESGCLEWTASRHPKGYGQFGYKGKVVRAHRWLYEQVHGPLPGPHVVVRHTCDNPPCVEITHLIAGSQPENVADRVQRGRNGWSGDTHCRNGHEYTEANTRWYRGTRKCRTCFNATMRRWRARQHDSMG